MSRPTSPPSASMPDPVAERAGRERARADDDPRVLGGLVELRLHRCMQREVAERAVSVPPLGADALRGPERHRVPATRASRSASSRGRSRLSPPPSGSARPGSLRPRRRSRARRAAPQAAWRVNSRIGHPRRRAMRRNLRSGLTAIGWPTASKSGQSVCESEYAVEIDRSMSCSAAISRTATAFALPCAPGSRGRCTRRRRSRRSIRRRRRTSGRRRSGRRSPAGSPTRCRRSRRARGAARRAGSALRRRAGAAPSPSRLRRARACRRPSSPSGTASRLPLRGAASRRPRRAS